MRFEFADHKDLYPFCWFIGMGSDEPPQGFSSAPIVWKARPSIFGTEVDLTGVFPEARGPRAETLKNSACKLVEIRRLEGALWAVFVLDDDMPGWGHDYVARKVTAEEEARLRSLIEAAQSPATIMGRRDRLQREAAVPWEDLCRVLADKIPEGLRPYARAYNWLHSETKRWKFPEMMEALVRDCKMLGVRWHVVKDSELPEAGFQSFEEMVPSLVALREAWSEYLDVSWGIEEYYLRIEFRLRH